MDRLEKWALAMAYAQLICGTALMIFLAGAALVLLVGLVSWAL